MWEAHAMGVLAAEPVGLNFTHLNKYKKKAGIRESNILFYFRKGEGTQFFFDEQEMAASSDFGFKRFGNAKKLKKYMAESNSVTKIADKAYDSFMKLDLRKKAPLELFKIFKEHLGIFQKTYSYYHACQPQYFSRIEHELHESLRKIYPETVADEIYSSLTLSDKLDPLAQEELEWLKIVEKIKRSLKGKKTISRDDLAKKPALYKLVNRHSMNYLFLGTVEVSHPWDFEHYLKLLNENINEDVTGKMRAIEKRRSGLKRRKAGLIKRHKIDKKMISMCDGLAKIGFNRMLLRFGWTKASYAYVEAIREIARHGTHDMLSQDNIWDLSFKELEDALLRKRYVPIHKIAERKEAYLFHIKDGKMRSYFGSKAIAEKERLAPEQSRVADEIRGVSACKGKVKGRVFLFTWLEKDLPKKMAEMKKGDILVAGQTRPFLMPAIKKAGAIVTDEGGITSHAAIVSRELGVPCVIGTRNATKILKTGDLVEVDANKGTVKVIRR